MGVRVFSISMSACSRSMARFTTSSMVGGDRGVHGPRRMLLRTAAPGSVAAALAGGATKLD